jgi:hypothetical protein
MPQRSSSLAMDSRPIVPIAAGALAIAIVVLDSIAHLDIAVGALYVAVVLLVVRSFERRAVLLVAAGCIAVTVSSHLLTREGPLNITALLNLVIGVSAIATATYLALRNQAAERALTDPASTDHRQAIRSCPAPGCSGRCGTEAALRFLDAARARDHGARRDRTPEQTNRRRPRRERDHREGPSWPGDAQDTRPVVGRAGAHGRPARSQP